MNAVSFISFYVTCSRTSLCENMTLLLVYVLRGLWESIMSGIVCLVVKMCLFDLDCWGITVGRHIRGPVEFCIVTCGGAGE